MDFKSIIRDIPDYPKKGINFKDITTLLKDPIAFQEVIHVFFEKLMGYCLSTEYSQNTLQIVFLFLLN